MPSGYFTLDQLAKAAPTVKDDSPLDATEPKIEPEEPRDDYHKMWGMYAFLYESAETLAVGGLTSLVPVTIGGLTLAPPDVWQVPNIDLGGGDLPDQAPPPPEQDLLSQICTPQRMSTSAVLQEVCMQLASSNACTVLLEVFPNMTQAPPTFDGAAAMNFPSGHSLQFQNFPQDHCFFNSGIGFFQFIICTPAALGGGCNVCGNFYFVSAQKAAPFTFDAEGKACGFNCGPNQACVYRTFALAVEGAMKNCVRPIFEDDLSDLGCVAT